MEKASEILEIITSELGAIPSNENNELTDLETVICCRLINRIVVSVCHQEEGRRSFAGREN